MTNYIKRIFIVLCLAGVFFLGYATGSDITAEPKQSAGETPIESGDILNKDEVPEYLADDVDFRMYWNVWKLIKDRYVQDGVMDTKLFYGSLEGMVASLGDPHSMFFDPKIADEFSKELNGSFEGVGMEIGVKKGQLMAIAPLPETPAERAGVRPGDAILSIDKVDTIGMGVDRAVSLIRGPGGKSVTLLMYRTGWDEPKEIVMVRERIVIPSVRFEMKEDLAYIKLTHFNADTSSKFRTAVHRALLERPRGIILDLRNNAGGFLDVAVDVASEWLEKEVVVTEKFRLGTPDLVHDARGRARLKDMKTVVLVNKGSASASEIVAGALQDLKRATVIGETTFGKGSVQEYETLPNGSAVKLTVAKWYTPNGHSIDEAGITPDIMIALSPDDYDNDKDPQLDAAVKVLHGEKVDSQKIEEKKGE